MTQIVNIPATSRDAPATPGVLLAGGLARRMGGGDKPMRPIGGRTILARAIARLTPQCDGLILSANADPARFKDFTLPVIADTEANHPGPLAGILAALDWAAAHRPEVSWVLSVAADCPFLPRDLVARLHHARAEQDAELAVAASGGRSHPVIGLWRVGLREELRHGGGRYPKGQPLDRALPARHRDMADGAARSVLQRQHRG
jgi:molybdenum cofactor guanylyltransferase